MLKILLMIFTITLAVPARALAADFQAGLKAYDAGDYRTALQIWTPLAESDHSTAQYNLGFMYEHGLGVSQNWSLAVLWYREAASNFNPGAMFNLGVIYGNGIGVSRDLLHAYMWFSLSAELGVENGAQNKAVVSQLLTHQQLEAARRLVDTCKGSAYQAC